MPHKTKKAFTMVELIFVIVIIGILSAIATPKLSSTVDAAYMSKGKSTLATVRSAIAIERQKSILRGNGDINVTIHNVDGRVFSNFTDENGSRILDNDLPSCTDIGCWSTTDNVTYIYYRDAAPNCTYKLESNRFVDKTPDPGCTELEK